MSSTQVSSGAGRRLGATALVAATSAAALLASGITDGTAYAATRTAMAMYSAADAVDRGKSIAFRGKLTTAGGTPLGGKTVSLQKYRGGTWYLVKRARTYSSGRVYTTARIYSTGTYRWYFRGTDAYTRDGSGTQRVVARTPINEKIVRTAAAQQGDPYRYGATGPDSFDCSGLTGYAHKQNGISIPRTSRDQYAASRHVSKSYKKPGDLIFFHDGGRVYHAAVYAGNGYMWTSPQSGESVKKKRIYNSSYYVGRFWR